MHRVEDYIREGLASKIVDPDGGKHVIAKAARLKSAGVDHPNLRQVPPFPAEGWKDNLSEIPAFSFRTLYEHFTERSVQEVVRGHDIERSTEDETGSGSYIAGDSTSAKVSEGTSATSAAPTDVGGSDSDSDSAAEPSSGDTKFRSFRGIDKGYRFFKSGHVQKIQYNSVAALPKFCFIRCVVMPSFRKDRKYSVRLCYTHTHTNRARLKCMVLPAG